MRWPRIAVVIATYGKTDTLRLAVESALRQSYPDVQLVIIVDGNPAQRDALRGLYGDDPRIALHGLARNSGEQSGPNNIGVALSDAGLVAFLNHDDLWLPDHLTILAEALLTRHADLAFSQAAGVFPRGAPEAAEDLRFYLMSRLPGGRYRAHYSFVGLSNVLVRRQTYDALGGLRAARDCWLEPSQDFLIRAQRAGARFAYADEFTSIALHSGIRAGSYLEGHDAQEHRLLAARFAEWDVTQLRAMVLRQLLPDDRWQIADRLVRATGFPLRLARPSLHGFRRGRLLDRLRATRGLSPLPRPAVSVTDFLSRRSAAHLTWVARGGLPEWTGGAALAPLLGHGWHEAEAFGAWTAARAAMLRFGVRARAGEEVELVVSCLVAAGGLQCVTARTRSTVLRHWRLRQEGNTPLEIVLRHRLAEPDEVVTLRLSTLFLYGAPHGEPSADRRRLGVGLAALRVRFPPRLDVSDNPQ